MRTAIVSLGALLLLLSATPGRAQPDEAEPDPPAATPLWMVLPLRAEGDGVPAEQLDLLQARLIMALGRGARVVPREELRQALEERNAETDAECHALPCQRALAARLGASHAVVVRLQGSGRRCELSARRIALASGRVEQSATQRSGCTSAALSAGLDGLVRALGGATAAGQGPARRAAPGRSPPPGAVRHDASGHFYFASPAPMSWFQAREWCAQRDAQLASVTSAAENRFVYERFATRRVVWLGATDEVHDGEWRWLSGEPFGFAPWFSGLGPRSGKGPNYLLMGTIADGVLPGGAFFRFGERWISDRDAGGVIYGVLSPHAVCEWVP
jgi:hypothetical protein